MYKNCFNKRIIFCILFCFIILPKIIVLYCFIIDVVWFHKFDYIYKVSFLLFLPLIESYFVSIVEKFCEENCHYFDETLTIFEEGTSCPVTTKQYLEFMFYKIIPANKIYFELTDQFFLLYKDVAYNAEKTLEYNVNILNNELLPAKFFEIYYSIVKNGLPLLSYFHVYLYTNYFFIWAYILWYSF